VKIWDSKNTRISQSRLAYVGIAR